jgi:hypothetical protein
MSCTACSNLQFSQPHSGRLMPQHVTSASPARTNHPPTHTPVTSVILVLNKPTSFKILPSPLPQSYPSPSSTTNSHPCQPPHLLPHSKTPLIGCASMAAAAHHLKTEDRPSLSLTPVSRPTLTAQPNPAQCQFAPRPPVSKQGIR